MKKIPLLYEMPIILTKDKEWHDEILISKVKFRSADVILLPEDAVLVAMPVNVEVSHDLKIDRMKLHLVKKKK